MTWQALAYGGLAGLLTLNLLFFRANVRRGRALLGLWEALEKETEALRQLQHTIVTGQQMADVLERIGRYSTPAARAELRRLHALLLRD